MVEYALWEIMYADAPSSLVAARLWNPSTAMAGIYLSYGVCRAADLKARPSQDHQDHTHVKYGEEQYFDN